MACGAVSIAILSFLASTLVLSSVPQVASSPSPLIDDVCGSTSKEIKEFDTKMCIKTLESEPRIAAAKDLLSISIALLEFAISNVSKRQLSYVQKQLKQTGLKADYKYVLQTCEDAYKGFVSSFQSARGEIPGEPDTATYDIMIGYSDDIDTCRNAITSKKISDAEIWKGIHFANLIGQVSFNTVGRLPVDGV
ncbi:uncharacterized protein [Henckelia pumila]|uniref:uncharacterized protein n=1 Tax=Henckelia pumila TaxID=405737 RepID=UPI003C6E8EC4